MEYLMKKMQSKRITTDFQKRIDASIRFIRSETASRPAIALILGSGLGELADNLSSRDVIETSSIVHYPLSTVEGHHGRLVFGKLRRVSVLAIQGRNHFYETGNLDAVLYPI